MFSLLMRRAVIYCSLQKTARRTLRNDLRAAGRWWRVGLGAGLPGVATVSYWPCRGHGNV